MRPPYKKDHVFRPQYFVAPPSASSTAWARWSILCHKASRYAPSMESHAAWAARLRPAMVCGFRRRISMATIDQACSMSDISGEFADHMPCGNRLSPIKLRLLRLAAGVKRHDETWMYFAVRVWRDKRKPERNAGGSESPTFAWIGERLATAFPLDTYFLHRLRPISVQAFWFDLFFRWPVFRRFPVVSLLVTFKQTWRSVTMLPKVEFHIISAPVVQWVACLLVGAKVTGSIPADATFSFFLFPNCPS